MQNAIYQRHFHVLSSAAMGIERWQAYAESPKVYVRDKSLVLTPAPARGVREACKE
ncbi:MAG: hypothetical protein ACKV19_00115 [Verrucomicrobiales bacterium]